MTNIEACIILNSAKLAVSRFNNNSGKNYKSAIRQAWFDGNYTAVGLGSLSSQLQCVRNQFGPSWLTTAQPITPENQPQFEYRDGVLVRISKGKTLVQLSDEGKL